jgi:creatinine amidohydrolase
VNDLLEVPNGDHANELETSLMLHLTPEWVAPLETAGDGAATPFKIPALGNTPGVWCPRDWAALTKDTGVGDPKAGSAEKGKAALEMIVTAIVPVLTQLSAAKLGDFPYVIPKR